MEYDKDKHLHLGYYEGGNDIESIAFKVAGMGEWRVFFNFSHYGLPVPASFKRAVEEPYGMHVFTVTDKEVNSGEVERKFSSFAVDKIIPILKLRQ